MNEPRLALADQIKRAEELVARLESLDGLGMSVEAWSSRIETRTRRPHLCDVCKTKVGEE